VAQAAATSYLASMNDQEGQPQQTATQGQTTAVRDTPKDIEAQAALGVNAADLLSRHNALEAREQLAMQRAGKAGVAYGYHPIGTWTGNAPGTDVASASSNVRLPSGYVNAYGALGHAAGLVDLAAREAEQQRREAELETRITGAERLTNFQGIQRGIAQGERELAATDQQASANPKADSQLAPVFDASGNITHYTHSPGAAANLGALRQARTDWLQRFDPQGAAWEVRQRLTPLRRTAALPGYVDQSWFPEDQTLTPPPTTTYRTGGEVRTAHVLTPPPKRLDVGGYTGLTPPPTGVSGPYGSTQPMSMGDVPMTAEPKATGALADLRSRQTLGAESVAQRRALMREEFQRARAEIAQQAAAIDAEGRRQLAAIAARRDAELARIAGQNPYAIAPVG
jgi:hypothetical protein